jgi:ubiquinone/menaquinone biosynthesis C-methylase UbiE
MNMDIKEDHGPSPWWAGYLLTSPLRRIVHDPKKILSPYIRGGMNVLEPGPGRGFFTLEIARLVGPDGCVYASELQSSSINGLEKRAHKAKLGDRIFVRQATRESLQVDDLMSSIDFVLSFAVAHEVAMPERYFQEIVNTLKSDGIILLVEPEGHVSTKYFNYLVECAFNSGLDKIPQSPQIDGSLVQLLRKKNI